MDVIRAPVLARRRIARWHAYKDPPLRIRVQLCASSLAWKVLTHMSFLFEASMGGGHADKREVLLGTAWRSRVVETDDQQAWSQRQSWSQRQNWSQRESCLVAKLAFAAVWALTLPPPF